jgi:hypothetical protein
VAPDLQKGNGLRRRDLENSSQGFDISKRLVLGNMPDVLTQPWKFKRLAHLRRQQVEMFMRKLVVLGAIMRFDYGFADHSTTPGLQSGIERHAGVIRHDVTVS